MRKVLECVEKEWEKGRNKIRKKGKERMISEETITNRLLECQGMNGRNKL